MEKNRTTLGEHEATRLQWLFTHHPPTPDQIPRYEAIREAAKQFVTTALLNSEPGADQEAGIRLVREAVMTFNASIALEGRK